MKLFGFNEIAFDLDLCSGTLPFKFRRQARSRPVCIGIGFKIAEMRHRFARLNPSQTGESEIPPFAVAFDPVKRRAPILFVHRRRA